MSFGRYISGIPPDLMPHFGCWGRLFSALSSNPTLDPRPDPGAIDHGICHLDLAYRCGFLAKEISASLPLRFAGQRDSLPSRGLLAKDFGLTDHGAFGVESAPPVLPRPPLAQLASLGAFSCSCAGSFLAAPRAPFRAASAAWLALLFERWFLSRGDCATFPS
ncbi:hypothetical protein Taro_012368 [Colocasia esculenta]|uniref:Uncharacterized protein n=1 Tax=Colocasia esculenta TaxID=4460 RepID=A0A843U8V8_COLES|nr:hypothetical protein [Colocasia esculenta]